LSRLAPTRTSVVLGAAAFAYSASRSSDPLAVFALAAVLRLPTFEISDDHQSAFGEHRQRAGGTEHAIDVDLSGDVAILVQAGDAARERRGLQREEHLTLEVRLLIPPRE
jgi:hypothetical protein